MKCESIVAPEIAKAIQAAEDHIHSQKESVHQDLMSEVIVALHSGIAIKDMRIVEVTTFQNNRQADYQVSITRKKT